MADDGLQRPVAIQCGSGTNADFEAFTTTYMTSWQVGFMKRVVTGKPTHLARFLWSVNNRIVNDRFKGQQIHLYPFFINFYQGMELLTEEKNRKFLLKRQIIGLEDKGAMGEKM